MTSEAPSGVSSGGAGREPAKVGHLRNKAGQLLRLVAVLAVGLAAGVFWHDPLARLVGWNPHGSQDGTGTPSAKQLWTCSMHPQVIQDKPGLCPICHMQLVPLKVGADAANATATNTPVGTAAAPSTQPGAGVGEGGAAQPQREIAYWWDPMMKPPYISQKPGKSPMGMDLVAVYKDEVAGGTAVTIDPVVIQNMGVRTVTAVEAPVHRTLRAVGYLTEPEPNRVDINLRVSGWIEKLHANTEGVRVRKGDPLFELYSPDLQVAIEEAITAKRGRTTATGDTARGVAEMTDGASRQKLGQLGLADDQIDELVALDRAPRTVVFRSPIDGYIYDKQELFVGGAVKAGDRALRLSDNSRLWLDAQVFERDLAQIAVGARIIATTELMPDRRYNGEVSFIHPRVDPTTRTALVRVTVENPALELKEGMYATIEADVAAPVAGVLVPRDAVLDTGRRQLVFLALPGGKFEPRRVEVGVQDDDGRVQVLAGLAPGDTVVTSGQFLLDSESRLKEAIQKFLESKTAAGPTASQPTSQSTTPLPAGSASAVISSEQQRNVDDVFAAYLRLADALGASVTPREIETQTMMDAARKAHAGGPPSATAQLHAVVEAAGELKGKSVDGQREVFKKVSAAVISLADRTPPTAAAAPSLYVLHCPMAGADWLQATKGVANPYYAEDMKECGQVIRSIEPSRAEKGRVE